MSIQLKEGYCMVTEQQVKELIFQSLTKVKEAGIIRGKFDIYEDTVLLGMGSEIESIAFVTFVTDLEERIDDMVGIDVPLRLQEIHDLNVGKAALIVKDMARVVVMIINRKIEAKNS
jgi:hypothetical protein